MARTSVFVSTGTDPAISSDILKANKTPYEQMGAGIYLLAIECDGVYLLGPEPDYIDPIYYCFRDLSSSIFRLIEEKRAPHLLIRL